MKKKGNGFAATGILYTILLIFLLLMTTLLVTLASRSRVLDKLKKDALEDEYSSYLGIVSGNYEIGDTVSYLGYNWKVMKDNGSSVQLIMNDYLSADELKENLPSDVNSSNVDSSGIPMCLKVVSSKYCYSIDYANHTGTTYTYKQSIVKPTIENWINKKMSENSLVTKNELVGMSFNDGVENITSYVRIPIYGEDGFYKNVITETVPASYISTGYYTVTNGCLYSPLLEREQDKNIIATLTRYDTSEYHYYVFPFTGNGYCNDTPLRYMWDTAQITPIITVKEK